MRLVRRVTDHRRNAVRRVHLNHAATNECSVGYTLSNAGGDSSATGDVPDPRAAVAAPRRPFIALAAMPGPRSVEEEAQEDVGEPVLVALDGQPASRTSRR